MAILQPSSGLVLFGANPTEKHQLPGYKSAKGVNAQQTLQNQMRALLEPTPGPVLQARRASMK